MSEQHNRQSNTFAEQLGFVVGEWEVTAQHSLVEHLQNESATITNTSVVEISDAKAIGHAQFRWLFDQKAISGECQFGKAGEQDWLFLIRDFVSEADSASMFGGPHHQFENLKGACVGESVCFEFSSPELTSFWDAWKRRLAADALRDANISRLSILLYPVFDRRWILVVNHVMSEPMFRFRSVFRFRRILGQGESVKGKRRERSDLGKHVDQPSRLIDLDERLWTLEETLTAKETELGEVEAELERHRDNHGFIVDEIDELEMKMLWGDQDRVDEKTIRNDIATEILTKFRELLELEDEISDLDDDKDVLEDDIETLNDQIEQTWGLLDKGYEEWVEEAANKAESFVVDELDLNVEEFSTRLGVPKDALRNLSADTRKILATCYQLYDGEFPLEDYSPIIGSMAKCCERTFADAFSARRELLLENAEAAKVIAEPKKYKCQLPDGEDGDKIKCRLGKVFKLVKDGTVQWSGTANCGVALLLFAGKLRISNGTSFEIVNPLQARGDAEDLYKLRNSLYRFQEFRNGIIHHDVANWSDVEQMREFFEICLRGLIEAFYC